MPEPSRLVLLQQLHDLEPGTKVRFLGCVHAYNPPTACLNLRTHFPATAEDTPTATVLIQGILEGINHELLEVGSWLNVVGYIQRPVLRSETKPRKRKHVAETASTAIVNAVMIWSAGAIRTDKYEKAAMSYQGVAE